MEGKRIAPWIFLTLCVAFLLLQASVTSAQETSKATFTILTCARGGLGGEINSALRNIEGVVKHRFDDHSSVLTVTFNPGKTNADEIGRALKKAGLDYQ